MATNEIVSSPKQKTTSPLIRSELNLQKWVCLFATSREEGRSRELVRKTKEGEIKVVIGRQYDDRGKEIEVGFLRVPAYKVLGALIKIWELNGKPDDWLTCSLRDLATVMDQRWGGKKGKDLKHCLKSLRDIPLQWIGFFLKAKEGFVDILEDQPLRFIKIKFLTKKRGGKEIDCRFKFKFDERLYENLVLGYTKPLRLDVICGLGEIATLVYCHVDLCMADKPAYTRTSKGLFEDLHITAKRYQYPANRKSALEKVINELITGPKENGKAGTPLSTGILTQMSLARTKDDKDWKVAFKKQPFRKFAFSKSKTEVALIVEEMEGVLGAGERNRAFYTKIAHRCPDDVIRMALRDTIDEERAGKLIGGSRPQFFGYWIQVLANNSGIDLGLKSSFSHILNN